MRQPTHSDSLDIWLAWLETLHAAEIELGLDRVREVMSRMDLTRPSRCIVVAGTNGKGSSVAMLEALYLQRGSSVGAYTSPHIHEYNERIRIGGRAASDDDIVASLLRVEAARQGVPLTYFEFGTLAAFDHFCRLAVETVILEIGLGGRLDAVNAADPDGGIITNVDIDHADWLGDDIETIAVEKAGVMRAGKPFVFGSPAVPDAIGRIAGGLACDLRLPGRDYSYDISESGWNFRGRDTELRGLTVPALPGKVQLGNAAAVLALVEALGETDLLQADLVSAALNGLAIDGRCQRIERRKLWLVDVAHNPAAACAIAPVAADAKKGGGGGLSCVIGVLDDKDVAGILEPLLPFVDQWIVVTPDSSRAVAAHELGRRVTNSSSMPCRIAPSIAEGCAIADRSDNGAVLVTGSFMTVGPALRWIENEGTDAE